MKMTRLCIAALLLFLVVYGVGCDKKETSENATPQKRSGREDRESGPLTSLSIPPSTFGSDWFVNCFLAIDDWSDIPNLPSEDIKDALNSKRKMESQGVRGIAVYGCAKAPNPDPKSFQIAVLRFKDLVSCEQYKKKECQYDGWQSHFRRVENVPYFAVDSLLGYTRYASVGTFFIEVKEILGDGEYSKAIKPIVQQLEGKK